MNLIEKWTKVPSDLKRWFDLRNNGNDVCWNGEAVLTLTLPKMEGFKQFNMIGQN